jgi:selenocysteine-specific elongation factor
MGTRFVVGTAGHIDHGKTALVKALTGVDTDRWEEEKRRGITIDLGFAPLTLGNGIQASIVDVPGHEGFVRNMLAGATGIDVALLVIAADEGIMPQTEEHLAIVELLAVRRGIPVLAKCDLVDRDWLELVRTEVKARLERSRVPWLEPVATSAVSGQGLDDLRAAIATAAADLGERPAEDLFRLPIDRVFAVAGAGTVVTGSTWSGTVKVGDSVRILPLDREARVRSIEVHGQDAGHAVPGRRTALALVGIDRTEIERGHAAVTGPGWRATTVMDAAIELLPEAPKALAPRTRVRVHLATAEVLGRVVQFPGLEPGRRGVVRLVLEQPLLARGGDLFVIRSFSPVTTIGGGVVLDPYPPTRPARLPERRLSPKQAPQERLLAWLEEHGLAGLERQTLPVRLGILPADVAPIIERAGKPVLLAGDHLVARAAVASAAERLGPTVERHHAEYPLDPGMSLQSLRATVAGTHQSDVPAPVLDLVLEVATRKGVLELAGGVARRPGWQPRLDGRAGDARDGITRRLEESRWEIPTIAELERDFAGTPVRAVLAHLVREGGVEQVDQERYASKRALEEFRGALEAFLREAGPQTPAQLRDRLHLTRKYLIPLLEWADRRGITRREGDARVLTRLTAGSGGP